jgi:hypothetical protein
MILINLLAFYVGMDSKFYEKKILNVHCQLQQQSKLCNVDSTNYLIFATILFNIK